MSDTENREELTEEYTDRSEEAENVNSDEEITEYLQENEEFDEEELPKARRKSVRVLAIIGLVIMAFLICWLIFCIITGSQYTLAVLFVTIIIPIILYIFLWLKKVFSRE